MLEQEGYDVMGAAFEVYNTLGSGFLEEVYQQSLQIELSRHNIPFQSQFELQLHYKEVQLKKTYIADLLAFGTLVIELKAVSQLTSEHTAQQMNYLKASKRYVGYLINFGHSRHLEWHRISLE